MDKRIFIEKGDITTYNVDAIVNAANNSLLGGCGVDGAIHKAAGPELLKECMTLNGCHTGNAKITKGYNLPAKYVIHTVGPIWDFRLDELPQQEQDRKIQILKNKLTNCYLNSLNVAINNNCKTIAFPAISVGVYSFPLESAAAIALSTINEYLYTNNTITKVIFVCFLEDVYNKYIEISKNLPS